MYELIYDTVAIKFLRKLPKEIQKRIIATLERCRVRPYPHVKRLVGSQNFRLRVGKYRVILDIQEKKLRILVIEIGHRKDIYSR